MDTPRTFLRTFSVVSMQVAWQIRKSAKPPAISAEGRMLIRERAKASDGADPAAKDEHFGQQPERQRPDFAGSEPF
jgi:hypothetical protein